MASAAATRHMRAVIEVGAHERGTVLTEHYNVNEYVARRVNYLGRHPEYEKLAELFPMVRGQAQQLFKEDAQLPSQEVRRRELDNEVFPLLPQPTTENTKTIDNYASYQPTEDARYPDSDAPRPQALTPRDPTPQTATLGTAVPYEHQERSTLPGTILQQEEYVENPHANVSKELATAHQQSIAASADINASSSDGTLEQQPQTGHMEIFRAGFQVEGTLINENMPQQSHYQRADPAQMQSILERLGQPYVPRATSETSSSPALPAGSTKQTAATTPYRGLGNSNGFATESAQHVDRPEQSSTTATPGPEAEQSTPKDTPRTSPLNGKFYSVDGVSALKNRGIHVPVKTKGVKRKPVQAPAQEDEERPADLQSWEDEDAEPPRKRINAQGDSTTLKDQPQAPDDVKRKMTEDEERHTPVASAAEPPRKRVKAQPNTKKRPLSRVPASAAKSQTKSGSKRKAVQALTEDEEFEDGFANPPAKRAKAQSGKKTTAKTTSSKPKPQPAAKTPKVNPAAAGIKPTLAAHGPAEATLANIISGAALPATPEQAIEASARRHTLLLQAYNLNPPPNGRKKTPAGKSPGLGKAYALSPDLPPEFFSSKNFPAGAEDDSVRCLCGVNRDDGAEMVQCDVPGCGVWQHLHCVGEAAPADVKDEDAQYLCQVCDPWVHRAWIQTVRQRRAV